LDLLGEVGAQQRAGVAFEKAGFRSVGQRLAGHGRCRESKSRDRSKAGSG
jgi:hypothetical protein